MNKYIDISDFSGKSKKMKLETYLNEFAGLPEDKKTEQVNHISNWLNEEEYIPFDLDIIDAIELINILNRYMDCNVNATIMSFLMAHQNYIVANRINQGLIANEMLVFLYNNAKLMIKMCYYIQQAMQEDSMFDVFSEQAGNEDAGLSLLYTNLAAAFIPSFIWLKEHYPQACYKIPDNYLETIKSFSNEKNAFNILNTFCKFLYTIKTNP